MPKRAEKTRRVIIVIVDGLSFKAPEKLKLPTINSLIAQGTYYKECYFLPTAHPRGWFHTCSLGNIAIVTGTIFFKQGQKQIQEMFDQGVTAHVAGGGDSYYSISVGYDFVNIGNYSDDEVMENAISLIKRNPNLVFMRVHLQDLGGAGYDVTSSRGKIPSIWAEGSKYPEVAERADQLLGKLVNTLKRTGKWSDTLLVVMADHGQADTGWHPPFIEESWRSPLVLVGPSIKADAKFAYSEAIDIAPTVCSVMGVDAPPEAIGIVLNDALADARTTSTKREATLKELNLVMKRYVDLRGNLLEAAQNRDLGDVAKAIEEIDGEFYSIERLVEWVEAGSVGVLFSADRKAYEKLLKIDASSSSF